MRRVVDSLRVIATSNSGRDELQTASVTRRYDQPPSQLSGAHAGRSARYRSQSEKKPRAKNFWRNSDVSHLKPDIKNYSRLHLTKRSLLGERNTELIESMIRDTCTGRDQRSYVCWKIEGGSGFKDTFAKGYPKVTQVAATASRTGDVRGQVALLPRRTHTTQWEYAAGSPGRPARQFNQRPYPDRIVASKDEFCRARSLLAW